MTVSPLKTASGIKASVVPPYDFADISWHKPSDLNYPKFKFFSDICVQVGELIFIKDKNRAGWRKMANEKTAIRAICQQYLGVYDFDGVQLALTQQDVLTFFKAGIIAFDATIYAPGAGDFVIFRGEKRLNVYKDSRLAGDDAYLENTEEFLKIIRNSLCDAPDEIPLADMCAEIWSKDQTAFRWVMHWLAARYQLPGFSPQTNLWFIGIRGTGKGTVMQAMTALLGGQSVGKASKEDIGKGWTDSLYGKELIEWDEFKSEKGWRDFGNLIKEKTGNDTISINQRQIGSFLSPAVAMHIFTSNEDRPIQVEDTDRQNSFIQTTMDETVWPPRAHALFVQETREFKDPNLVSGFAALLNSIEIDIAFITRPFRTAKREELRAESEDTVITWIKEATKWDGSSPQPWEDWHTEYRDWVRDHLNQKSDDVKSFKRKAIKAGWATCSPRYYNGKSQRCAILTNPPEPPTDLAVVRRALAQQALDPFGAHAGRK